jgi:hypothetical protein
VVFSSCNKRVMEKFKECVEEFSVACSFKNVEDQFHG